MISVYCTSAKLKIFHYKETVLSKTRSCAFSLLLPLLKGGRGKRVISEYLILLLEAKTSS